MGSVDGGPRGPGDTWGHEGVTGVRGHGRGQGIWGRRRSGGSQGGHRGQGERRGVTGVRGDAGGHQGTQGRFRAPRAPSCWGQGDRDTRALGTPGGGAGGWGQGDPRTPNGGLGPVEVTRPPLDGEMGAGPPKLPLLEEPSEVGPRSTPKVPLLEGTLRQDPLGTPKYTGFGGTLRLLGPN